MTYIVWLASRWRVTGVSAMLLGIFLAGSPSGVAAQVDSFSETEPPTSFSSSNSVYVAPGKYAVVIDLDAYRLHFRHGENTLWSAEIGTGTGLTLRENEDREWAFTTPSGTFQVQYKARNPDWIRPDWFFIENGLPVPPEGDPSRREPGGLGAAAVYLGSNIAIHGTDKPELLGQQVSHGCIRLANEDAIRLFHNVQVGTDVIVVGDSEPITEEMARELARKVAQARARVAASGTADEPDPLSLIDTDELVSRLEDEMWIAEFNPAVTHWTRVASQLLQRGIEGDEHALRGILRLVRVSRYSGIESEYTTFLADAYSRGALQVLSVIADLDPQEREEAAQAIVAATMGMYSGSVDGSSAPWPTRRVPRRMLDTDGQQGWDILREAERAYREEQGSRGDRVV